MLHGTTRKYCRQCNILQQSCNTQPPQRAGPCNLPCQSILPSSHALALTLRCNAIALCSARRQPGHCGIIHMCLDWAMPIRQQNSMHTPELQYCTTVHSIANHANRTVIWLFIH
jgi:hypothetical protein